MPCDLVTPALCYAASQEGETVRNPDFKQMKIPCVRLEVEM